MHQARHQARHRPSNILAALAVLAGALGAQAPQLLVAEGQALPGGDVVTGIAYVHVDDVGGWLVQVTTDRPSRPTAVLRESPFWGIDGVWKQVGDRAHEPDDTRIAAFDSFTAEAFGGVIWNARLSGTAGGAADDEALYFEDSLWFQEGPIAAWPSTDFPAGSRWISFDDVRGSLEGGTLLLRGRADDPTVPGHDETFAAVGGLCGSIGVLCGLERIAQAGWTAPGTDAVIEAVRLEPAAGATSSFGAHVVWSCDLRGQPATDGCVYRYSFPPQHELLAQEGKPSPVTGRRWGPLEDPGVHVNAAGDWTLRATLDASDPSTDAVIVSSGLVVVQEGDGLPAIDPFTFDGFGDGRALLDDGGHVVWYGHWQEPGRRAEGLFRDAELLVRTGVTTVGGRLLAELGSRPDDMALTPDGDRLLFKGTLEGGVEGAFVLGL
jgi:hypothetical protein